MNRISLFDNEYCDKELDRIYHTPITDYIIRRNGTLRCIHKNKTRQELLDWLNIKEPFPDYELSESWPFDPQKCIAEQLDSIIEYFSQLQSVQNYIMDYQDGNIEWLSRGASRRVYKSINYPVVYKVSSSDEHAQSIKAIRCWIETANPFLVPILGVFKHADKITQYEDLILIKPLLDIRNNNYVEGIRAVPDKIDYIRKLTGQLGSCWMNEGEFTFFDGCMMYRGSNNWVWHNGIPIWFDLGEVLLNEPCGELDEPFWNHLQQFKVI